MADKKEYSSDEVKPLLESAIKKLQERDPVFLDPEFDINERTVTHRLGMYLAELFPDWDVDCEYNRIFDKETEGYIAKKLDLPEIENGVPLEDTEAKTVYPDIIVHKRKTPNNFLAIEVKMGWKNTKRNFDEVKAEAYKAQIGYQHSAFVIIGPGNESKIIWIK